MLFYFLLYFLSTRIAQTSPATPGMTKTLTPAPNGPPPPSISPNWRYTAIHSIKAPHHSPPGLAAVRPICRSYRISQQIV